MGWASICAVLEQHRAITGATKMDQAVELIFFLVSSAILAVSAAAVLVMGGANA